MNSEILYIHIMLFNTPLQFQPLLGSPIISCIESSAYLRRA